jgi:Tol biopolymer transport system component
MRLQARWVPLRARLSQFQWYDRSGTFLRNVGEPASNSTFRLSPDGLRIAVSRDHNASTNIWTIDERGVPSPFTTSPTINWYPAWSPKAQAAIVWSGGATRDLLWKKIGSATEEALTKSGHIHNPNDWSADGRFILYYEFGEEDTQRDLWVLPFDARGMPQEPKEYLRTKYNEWQARFSPGENPKWVAYTSDESGRSEVYVQSFPERHGEIRISTGGGQFPIWGPFGKELFYVAPDNNLMRVSLKASGETVDPSTSTVLFPLPGSLDGGTPPYDVTPDGQHFLVLGPPGRVGHALKLILNWPALLKSDTTNQ